MRRPFAPARSIGLSILAVSLVGMLALSGTGEASGRTRLVVSAAPFAIAGNFVRSAPTRESVDFEMYLGLKDPQGAEDVLQRVSDPKSSSYARYLERRQFRARYARSSADVAQVSSWLSSGRIPRRRGCPRTICGFRHGHGGRRSSARSDTRTGVLPQRQDGSLRATTGAPSIPTSLAGVVRGVNGLTQVFAKRPAHPVPPGSHERQRRVQRHGASGWRTRSPSRIRPACLPYAPCGYTPAELQGAYGMRPIRSRRGPTAAE